MKINNDVYDPKILREYFYIEQQEDGILRLHHAKDGANFGPKIVRGQLADTGISDKGYRRCRIVLNGKTRELATARVIWVLFHNRQMPEGMVPDHDNRVKLDNSIENLKVVSMRSNTINRHTCDDHLLGVKEDKRRKRPRFEARTLDPITKKYKYLGTFSDPIIAARAYDEYIISAYGADAPTNASLGRYATCSP